MFALRGAILVGEPIDCKRQVRFVTAREGPDGKQLREAIEFALANGAHVMARLILPEMTLNQRLDVLTACAMKKNPEQVDLCLPYVRRENLHAVTRACVAGLSRTSIVSPDHLEVFGQLLAHSDFESLPAAQPHIIFQALTTLPDPLVGAVLQCAMPRKDAHWAIWTAYEEGRQDWAAQLRAQPPVPVPPMLKSCCSMC